MARSGFCVRQAGDSAGEPRLGEADGRTLALRIESAAPGSAAPERRGCPKKTISVPVGFCLSLVRVSVRICARLQIGPFPIDANARPAGVAGIGDLPVPSRGTP